MADIAIAATSQMIPMNLIIANDKQNFRTNLDADTVKETADSMKRQGQLTPVRVARITEGKNAGKYDLIYGFRRYNAATLLKWDAIRAEVVDTMDPAARRLSNLAENLAREDLSTYDQANAFFLINKENELTHESIGKAVGKSTGYIGNLIRQREDLADEVLQRWQEECMPGFGYDDEGKKDKKVKSVCTQDFLKALRKLPRVEQVNELHKALGLIAGDEETADGEGDGEGEEGTGAAVRTRASLKDLKAALATVKEKLKETPDDLELKGMRMALTFASGGSKSIKGIIAP